MKNVIADVVFMVRSLVGLKTDGVRLSRLEARALARDLWHRLRRPAQWEAAVSAVHQTVRFYSPADAADLAAEAFWTLRRQGKPTVAAALLLAAAEVAVDSGDIVL